jgi:hypothetical protein
MGMKKAKLIKKLEDIGVLLSVATGLLTDLFYTRNAEEEKILANMLSATKELVSVLKAASPNKHDKLRMRTHEKWMKMASIYATCGQHDLALATMKKIDDDRDQMAASKTARNHNPPKVVEEECTWSSASDERCKGNAWDYKDDKWCDAIETGKAAVESGDMATDALCIECKQTPSTHKCRRCKQFVCNPCCLQKRGLELIW